MKYREFGRTGWQVSEVSFGAWGLGGDMWGPTDDAESLRTLHRAVDLGVNLFDTADVYGDGRSERLLARLRRERRESILIATKAGRRLPRQEVSGYNRANLTAFVERSLRNLETEALDLLQLHCPPLAAIESDAVFEILDDLVRAGKLRHYGVSVETVQEGLTAIRRPGVQSIQIIINMFRLKPVEEFLPAAATRNVAVLARVPLASGLLSGRMRPDTRFAADDHRVTNRHGERFDVGETFSGMNYEAGLRAVDELRPLVPPGATLAQVALRWILMFPAVTAVIPGAKRPQQVEENVGSQALSPLPADAMARVRDVYDRYCRAAIHRRW